MKNVSLFLVLALGLTACGEGRFSIRRGKGCTTTQTSTGAVIKCQDGSVSEVSNGTNGTDGSNGTNGTNGSNGTNGTDGSNGTNGTNGSNGTNGFNGSNGIDGTNGTNGLNGENGSTGMPGKDGSTIEPMIPCPNLSGAYPEVLLCIDNSLYAVFFGSEKDVRYAKIPAGSYKTTDGRECKFKVVSGCQLSY